MVAVLAGLVLLLVILTALPLLGSQRWWVRDWEFPRLQLAALAALLLVLESAALERGAVMWALLAVTAICGLYQFWWIVPYTRLYRREVRPASREIRDRLCILNANVLMTNRDADRLLALVRRERPDVLITLESDAWWEQRLDSLLPEYPHVLRRPQNNLYGMHLYSRLPLEEASVRYLVAADVPSMHVLLRLRSGAGVRLHCLHPRPPAPGEDDSSRDRDAELVLVGRGVRKAALPVIVAGDLNDVAWSATTRLFRKISGLLDPRVGRGMFNTFHARYPLLRWPLDHLFHSDEFTLVRLQRLPAIGSDHFPILVELALEPRRGAHQDGLDKQPDDEAEAGEELAAAGVPPGEVPQPGERP